MSSLSRFRNSIHGKTPIIDTVECIFENTFVGPPDSTPPIITLLGNPSVEIIQGVPYLDAGATAEDNVDGDITGDIITVNPVDEKIPDTYFVTFDVTDNAGNAAAQVTRTVTVITAEDAIANIQDYILSLNLPNGVENSLLGPLKQITKLLDDGNPNNDGAVCNKLESFIEHVDSEETAGELTSGEAAALRDAAQAILDAIGCDVPEPEDKQKKVKDSKEKKVKEPKEEKQKKSKKSKK